MFSPNILTSSAQITSWCVPFNSIPSSFSCTFQMAHGKAKLKNNGDKTSPCFVPFWTGSASHRSFTYANFTIGFI
jgi:hypothetical protein